MKNPLFIYCVTNSKSSLLEELNYNLVGVGKKKFSKKYIDCNTGDNIQDKEEHYSELTFHYWFWKNKLKEFDNDTWIGFCQKRRFWKKNKKEINNFEELKENLLYESHDDWNNYDSVICNSINLGKTKFMKLIKRGWRNFFFDPKSIFKKSIKLHFDMHHGYGILEKASKELKEGDRDEFLDYVSNNSVLNPHIMFIAKKKILNKWFIDCFEWLFKCEKLFGFDNLTGYDKKRLYAFLAERYLSFWFHKYARPIAWHWTFYDIEKEES